MWFAMDPTIVSCHIEAEVEKVAIHLCLSYISFLSTGLNSVSNFWKLFLKYSIHMFTRNFWRMSIDSQMEE